MREIIAFVVLLFIGWGMASAMSTANTLFGPVTVFFTLVSVVVLIALVIQIIRFKNDG
jgi:predicted tellurium resistance membrane protein TerC